MLFLPVSHLFVTHTPTIFLTFETGSHVSQAVLELLTFKDDLELLSAGLTHMNRYAYWGTKPKASCLPGKELSPLPIAMKSQQV